jgi:putative IMPACT (imprinted ancient) family translation regulator
VIVAVIRYYGGINLGVGELINAYRTAAKEAIENSIIIDDEDKRQILVSFAYSQMPAVMKIVKGNNCHVLEKEFSEDCHLKLSYPLSNRSLLNELQIMAQIHSID